MGSRPPALVLDGVSKRFARGSRAVDVLRGVSLSLAGGQVVALVGENGAGKTTLLRMIAGLIEPSSGEIFVHGHPLRADVQALQPSIGWCSSDERSFYPRLSGEENLVLFAALHGLDRATARARIRELADVFDCRDALQKPFQNCSTGQRQRLNLLRALAHQPDILLLDEPARSLDAATRETLVAVLRAFAARPDHLVIVAGHDFDGFEDLWESVAILHAGELVVSGPTAEILSGTSEPVWEVGFDSRGARDRALAAHAELAAAPEPLVATCAAHDGAVPLAVLACASEAGAEVLRFERRSGPSLRGLLARIARGELPTAPRSDSADEGAQVARGELPPRPHGIVSALRAARALARRDRLVYLSHRFQTALKLALLIAWILTLYFVSRLVDARSPEAARHFSGDYFTYALLGMGCLRISQVCLVQMAGSLREEQLQGTVEPMFVTGRAPILLVASGLLWPLVSDIAGLFLVFGAGALILGAELASANVPALIVAALGTVVAMAVWGILSSAFVIAFKRGDPVALLVNLITIGLSGVFFPVEMMPSWLQPVSRILPLTWGLEGVRAAALRGAGFASPEYRHALLGLAVLVVCLTPIAVFAFSSAVAYARRAGSLAQS